MRSWVEISEPRLRHNLSVLRRYLAHACAGTRSGADRTSPQLDAQSSKQSSPSPQHHASSEFDGKHPADGQPSHETGIPAIIAVVKADAYGHGLDLVAPILYQQGIRHFAVAQLDEAEDLRKALAKLDAQSSGHENQDRTEKAGSDQVAADPCEAENEMFILVLGGIQEGREDDFRRLGATASVFDSRPHPPGIPAQLKIDTGMGRLGIPPEDVRAHAARLGNDLTGVFSHLHAAEDDPEETRRQIDLFLRCTDFLLDQHGSSTRATGPPINVTKETHVSAKSLEAENPQVSASGAESEEGEGMSKVGDGEATQAATSQRRIMRHLSASAGLPYPTSHLDAVRVGLALYGIDPGDSIHGLLPVLAWKSRILTIKDVAAGSTIGYGATYRCPRDTRIGHVPIGYADGYSRHLSNRAQVELHTQGQVPTPNDPRINRASAPLGHSLVGPATRTEPLLAPVIGLVSMDLITIDLTAHPDIAPGTEVTLLSPDPDSPCSAQSLAALQSTIPYEVLTSIGTRSRREIVR